MDRYRPFCSAIIYLGSTRLVTDRQGNILQQSDFTPYGRTIDNALMVSGNSSYLWCGKELQQFIDISWYDSVARFLTTDGVFTSPDPICEKYYHISPYAYCGGDPINFIDPKGEDNYYFDDKGYFEIEKTDDLYDRLIFNNNNEIIINDKTIMSNMNPHRFGLQNLEGDIELRTMHYAISDYSSDLVAAFVSLSQNTNVEWGLYRSESGRMMLGTQHLNHEVDLNAMIQSAGQEGLHFLSLSSKIHSHPLGYSSEKDSMAVDFRNAQSHPSIRSFVYFPASNNYYLITKNGIRLIKGFPKL